MWARHVRNCRHWAWWTSCGVSDMPSAWCQLARQLEDSDGWPKIRCQATVLQCYAHHRLSRYLYTLFVSLDTCFQLKRHDILNKEKDPILGSRMAYFVEEKGYKEVLAGHSDQPEVCWYLPYVIYHKINWWAGLFMHEPGCNRSCKHQIFKGICCNRHCSMHLQAWICHEERCGWSPKGQVVSLPAHRSMPRLIILADMSIWTTFLPAPWSISFRFASALAMTLPVNGSPFAKTPPQLSSPTCRFLFQLAPLLTASRSSIGGHANRKTIHNSPSTTWRAWVGSMGRV